MQPPLTTPQVYPLSVFNKIFHGFLATGLLLFTVYMFRRAPAKSQSAAWIVIPMIAGLSVLILTTLRRKVTINSDSIINTGLLGTKEIPLQAIRGMRLNAKNIILEPSSAGYPRITIGNYDDLARSGQLLQWLQSNVKNLNAEDLETDRQQLLQNDALGDSTESRQLLLKQAKTTALVYNVAGSITALICIFADNRFSNLLLLGLPLAGIVLLFLLKGLIRFYTESSRSVHPAVFLGILFSSGSLLIHTIKQYSLLQVQPIWMPVAGITAIISGVLYIKGRNPTAGNVNGQLVLMLMAAFLLAVGSTRQLNCAYDQAPAKTYRALIQDKYIYKGKNTSYHLLLGAWGTQDSGTNVVISRRLYRQLAAGDSITVQLKPGLLQVPWYWVEK